jgi:hypothetical protein
MPRYVSRHRQELIKSFMKLGKDKSVGGPSRLAANIWAAYLDELAPESALPQVQKNGNIPDTKPPAPVEVPAPEPVEDRGAQLLKEFQNQVYGGGHNERANAATTAYENAGASPAS